MDALPIRHVLDRLSRALAPYRGFGPLAVLTRADVELGFRISDLLLLQAGVVIAGLSFLLATDKLPALEEPIYYLYLAAFTVLMKLGLDLLARLAARGDRDGREGPAS